MHPVVKRAVELVATVGRDELRELALKSGEDIVEGKGVGIEMNPL